MIFVKIFYTANVASGVDYMEFGYKASKEIFDVKEFTASGNFVMKMISEQLLETIIPI